jgi:predicted DNA-binding transcriptional regulator AlpA
MDDLFAYAGRPVATSLSAPKLSDAVLWSANTVRLKTGLSRASIYRYVRRGEFPRRLRIGPGRVAWMASEVTAWIESRPRL